MTIFDQIAERPSEIQKEGRRRYGAAGDRLARDCFEEGAEYQEEKDNQMLLEMARRLRKAIEIIKCRWPQLISELEKPIEEGK